MFAAAAVGWLFWCLYWPYLAVQQDTQAAIREAESTRRVCLEQPNLTAADCATDYQLNRQRLVQAVRPPGKSAYQLFAGDSTEAVIGFMFALVAVPLGAFYLAVRLGLGTCRLLARIIRLCGFHRSRRLLSPAR